LATASLTLINTGVLPGYRWHFFARLWQTPVIGEIVMATTSRAGFRVLIQRGCPRGLPEDFVDSMYDCLDAGTKRAVLRLYRATNNPADLASRFARAFRGFSCPVLVVWGRADPYIAASFVERQREFFPAAEIAVLDQSGHWPHADAPERVAALALPFWRAATSKAPTA
jgi:pimeloyl-ACP methyl ester carboxylesterase